MILEASFMNKELAAEFLNVMDATNGVHVKYVGFNVKIRKLCLASSVMLPWVG